MSALWWLAGFLVGAGVGGLVVSYRYQTGIERPTSLKVPRYVSVFKCSSCTNELTWGEKMESHGVCPYCGNASGDTIVDTKNSSRRVYL